MKVITLNGLGLCDVNMVATKVDSMVSQNKLQMQNTRIKGHTIRLGIVIIRIFPKFAPDCALMINATRMPAIINPYIAITVKRVNAHIKVSKLKPRLLSERVLAAISNLQTRYARSRTTRIELPEYTPPIQY